MIPVRLKMRNFMCYREVPELSFAGIHTACLSGDNGSGKSALIDAMTWALWGEARTNSDDDLIHTTQQEMEVEFDFTVGGQLYRVIRKRSRPRRAGGQGQSTLDFQIAHGDGFRSVAGDKMSQTQEKITNTLHMDYHTFINSAYLRQGHADEFTEQSPSKRKEVLANILGLEYYDTLEEKARELARQREAEKARQEISLKEIALELGNKPAYEAELARAQDEVAEIEKQIKEKESAISDLKQKRDALEKKQVQLEQLSVIMADRENQLKRLKAQMEQHRVRIKSYELLITQRVEIEDGYARFAEARALCEDFNKKLSALHHLNEQKSALTQSIEQEKAKLERTLALTLQRLTDLRGEADKLSDLKAKAAQLQTVLQKLAEQEQAVNLKKRAVQEEQVAIANLEVTALRLEQEIRETHEKLHLLATQKEAKCPLCESDLGADGIRRVRNKYVAEQQSKEALLQSTREQIEERGKTLKTLQEEVAQLEAELAQKKSTVEKGLAIVERSKEEAEKAQQEIADEEATLKAIERQLTGKEYAVNEQNKLKEVMSDIARLDYDPAKHDQLRKRVTDLQAFEERRRELEKAEALISQEKESLERAEALLQELSKSLENENRQKQELAKELVALPPLLQEIAAAEAEQQALASRQKQAQEALWNARANLQRCASLEAKKQEKETLLTQAANEEGIYKELAEAFGKKGIQALLIDMALPEIETEANRLLSRMTDNRMHVNFETQRITKKGDAIETLDINISDELGTRNYEMFSGGEAFRINFAIRIALSRLLARRSGAPLPTLIIDEGFGTQDATGIEKLKEAITSIQDDFEKIIVITHIEELRDAFPTRIDVVKKADGSTFMVS